MCNNTITAEHTITLENMLYLCPQPWINMITYMADNEYPTNSSYGYSVKTINTVLEPYRARYVERNNGKDMIIFETKKHMLAWILRFS
jgi:hypothetical protein